LRRFCPLQSQRVNGLQLSLPGGCALQVDGDDATGMLAHDTRLSIRVGGQIPVVYALPSQAPSMTF
jgi:hypothetical protein